MTKDTNDYFDSATIEVRAGNGGNGSATFRREKFVPRGGPDGGDGGRGGHIYIAADPSLNTLLAFRYQRKFIAEQGGHGSTRKCHGRQGADTTIAVPPGTVVRAALDGEVYSIDLERPGQRLLAARGGKGGLGNVHFTTAVRQAPRMAELGEPGQELTLQLELKLLADVGLVGFPNAGKSTLLSVISAARPKIAAYPFTTLQPNLGLVEVGDLRFVVADMPGLIEGAHQGVGLGFDFLRHIERTRLLIHVVDAAGVEGRDPLADYHRIQAELSEYDADLVARPQLVVLNKIDLPDARENLDRLCRELPVDRANLFPIAAATREGLDALLARAGELLRDMITPQRRAIDFDEAPLTWPIAEVDPNQFTIERDASGWRVHGRKVERLMMMTNFAQAESLDRVQRVLDASGITEALRDAGIEDGATVHIHDAELTWSEEGHYE